MVELVCLTVVHTVGLDRRADSKRRTKNKSLKHILSNTLNSTPFNRLVDCNWDVVTSKEGK